MAASWGMPGYPFVDTPHPIAILDDVETGDRAQDLVPLVLALLSGEGTRAGARR